MANAANETKEKVQEIRNSIEVVSHTKDDDGEPIVKEVKEEENKEEEVKEPEKSEKEEKVIEASEEEVTEEAEVEEEDKEDEKIKRVKEKAEKRISKLANKTKELERELAAVRQKLADEGKGDVLTADDVEKLAEEKANQKSIERQLVNAVNKLNEDASKIDKEFNKKMNEVIADVGIEYGNGQRVMPSVLIGILEDIDNGAAVLNHLANDIDEAERIFELHSKPIKMANEVNKLANKIKPKVKQISKAPDPVKPLGGNASKANNAPPPNPTKNIQDYIEWRNKDIAEKRAAGRVNLR